MMNNIKSRKNVIFVILFIFATIYIVFVYLAIKDPMNNIVIYTSPTNTNILLSNGIKIKSNAPTRIESGTYEVTIVANDFTEEKLTIEVSEVGLVEYGVLLYPTNEAGLSLLENTNEQQWREFVGQKSAARLDSMFSNKYPLINFLPKITARYRVDYALNPEFDGSNNSYIIWISADIDADQMSARQWILSADSVNDYDVRVRALSSLPDQSLSEGWGPSPKDISDPDL